MFSSFRAVRALLILFVASISFTSPVLAETATGIGAPPQGIAAPGTAAPAPGTTAPVQPGTAAPADPGAVAGGPPPLVTTPPPLPQQPAVAAIRPHWVAVNGQAAGPFDEAALRQMAASGQLKRETLVWAEGMTDWTAAGLVQELTPILANIPPEVRFDPKTFLIGSWRGDPVPTQIQGFTSAQIQGTATYSADGKLRILGKLTGTSVYGQFISMTISGDGTYTAEMQGQKQIVITPMVAINYTSDNGGAGGVDQMTAPFVINIIDNNTVADEQGNRSYRIQ